MVMTLRASSWTHLERECAWDLQDGGIMTSIRTELESLVHSEAIT